MTTTGELRRRDRERAWAWAASLNGRKMSVWRLEAVKAAIARAEEAAGSLCDPNEAFPPSGFASLCARLTFLSAAAAAMGMFLLWTLRFALTALRPDAIANSRRLGAMHGEWSTRTRHLLKALPSAEPPCGTILLLGRLTQSRARIAANLSAQPGGRDLPPLIVPMSAGSALKAMATDWPRLLLDGMRQVPQAPARLGFREWIGIAFRVWHGAAAARWWHAHGPRDCEVIFAMTGTADTTLLEQAIQADGGRTVHAVHGQATGPNFTGISDVALFRSAHDAAAYTRLDCYGACKVQRATVPETALRGDTGLLLLTNLAHQMNPEFRRNGMADEIALIRCAGEAARRLGQAALPLLWKPHPVIDSLADAESVRQAARDAGFRELAGDAALAEAAAAVRWVVSSPSTIALDLLQLGILPLMLDPQGTLTDTAISSLPRSPWTRMQWPGRSKCSMIGRNTPGCWKTPAA